MTMFDISASDTCDQSPDTAYRPLILDANHEAKTVSEFRAHPGTLVCDTMVEQLRDLMKTRHPRRTLSETELDRLMHTQLGPVSPDDYGTWVYYPWSRRLVHLLPEAEFVELRTNRNQYKISPDEQRRLAARRVGVVGLSVGHSVAMTLALERGCGELRLADFDALELSNLNRIRTGVHNLGVPKVVLTAREIAELDPYLRLICYSEGLTTDNMEVFFDANGPLDLIIDECDSLDIKVRLRLEARRRRIPVVMDTSDRGMLDIERFDLEPDRPIFHGLVNDLPVDDLSGLTTEEKLPYVLNIVGLETMSARLRASMLEIGQSISTWPQLGSDVTLGGAIAADVVRRIGLRDDLVSGRYFIDPDTYLSTSDAVLQIETKPRRKHAVPPPLSYLSQVCEAATWRSPEALPLAHHDLHPLLEAAVTAPSGGNMQPWLWLYHQPLLLLTLDRRRAGGTLDFESRGSLVALGAATENVVLAAHHQGFEVRLHPFPFAHQPDVVAAFEFFERGQDRTESHAMDHLYDMIDQRHTNRRVGPRVSLSQAQREAIVQAAQSVPGSTMQLFTDPHVMCQAGAILGRGDRLRLLDPALHAEFVSEVCWTPEEGRQRHDGIAIEELDLRPLDQAGLAICRHWDALQWVRRCGGGSGLETLSNKAIDGASAIALITMPGTRRIDYFNGGRAVQRAWLMATSHQVALQPMTALPYLFARLAEGNDSSFDAETADALAHLRQRYTRLFQLPDTVGEIMLCRLAVVAASKRRPRRRPVADVAMTTTGGPAVGS